MFEEFKESGEQQLLESLHSYNVGIKTIFDVGANQGIWTKLARSMFPSASIHSFEIVPETFRHCLLNVGIDPNTFLNNFGMSDCIQSVKVKYCAVNDALSTAMIDMEPGTVANIPWQWRNCLTVSGDFYVESNQIDYIDYLKIDVEGLEDAVLKGFQNMLNSSRIGAIQFEYGTANILSRYQLRDYYQLLTPLGYVLGQIRKDRVEFRNYNLVHENYGTDGCNNYIAVHQSRSDIFKTLQGN